MSIGNFLYKKGGAVIGIAFLFSIDLSNLNKNYFIRRECPPMKFSKLQDYFAVIAKTSSRTEITQLLAGLFGEASAEEVKIIANLSLGSLRPSYEGTQFNVAERTMKKILAQLLGVSEEELNKLAKLTGDLGTVISHGTWEVKKHLTVTEVYENLMAIEEIAGTGAQEERARALGDLLRALEPASAGLVVRMVIGKLRMGFSDMTLIDALSWMIEGNKSYHDKIEHAYNICADIGHIAYLLKKHGMEGIDKVSIVVGIPIRPAAAERLPTALDIVDKLGDCVAQPKLDGFRLQVHIDNTGKDKKIHFFSRNLIDMSDMFPDLVKALQGLPVKSCIFEGEAIAYDEATGAFTPFQETVKRKRKHDIEAVAEELPLRLFLFDLLYLDGESLLSREHHTRRNMLVDLMKKNSSDALEVIAEWKITTGKELEDYFYATVGEGLEGLIAKRPKSHYQPGKRNFNWIKLKRQDHGSLEDTIDAVVLGYYAGKGKRTHFGIGAFLVGIYNKHADRYETVAKIGTGLTDLEWVELKKLCDAIAVKKQPQNVICAPELAPDVWVTPELIVLIRADEITQSPLHAAGKAAESLGLALRFPRIMGYRPDKSAHEATTLTELKKLFQNQKMR
jgi:DNA ligase-1